MLNEQLINPKFFLFFPKMFFPKKIYFFIFIIQVCNIRNIQSTSYINLPFSYINNKSKNSIQNASTPEQYFESLLTYPIFTTLKINNKDIKFHITLDRYSTYISEKTYKEININSEEDNNEKLYSLDYIGINRAKLKKNCFSFISNNSKNISFNNYSFFITTKLKNSSDYNIKKHGLITETEEIGLNIVKGNKYETVQVEEYDPYSDYDYLNFLKIKDNNFNYKKLLGQSYVLTNDGYYIEEKTNIISQLKENNYISSYAFSIKIGEREEKGEIIIGGYPHDIDKLHYNSKYFIYDTVSVKYYYYHWHYEFKNIIYDGEKLPWVKEAEISLNFGFILSAYNYKDFLDKHFFKNEKFAEFCIEEKVDEYFIKICQENVIKYFKPIYFYLFNTYLESNQTDYIVFNYTDLFVKAEGNNNLYYFQMIFVDNSYKWIFGRPLFKKYRTVFDMEKKILGFYTETGEYIYEEDNYKKNKENKRNFNFSYVVIFVLLFIFGSLMVVGVLLYKILTHKRKKKANELDDNFDYTPTSDENKENPLLIN